jgi:hypothetical protein
LAVTGAPSRETSPLAFMTRLAMVKASFTDGDRK